MTRKTRGGEANGRSEVERRVVTPRPDLFVIKLGEPFGKLQGSKKEQTKGVLDRVARVMTKPGADRAKVFQSSLGKPVYAYFIRPDDPTRVVREDVSGQQTVGRFVGGRYRALRSDRVV